MVVALIALAVALGGSAFAAGGGFAGSDGTIQGCVTQPGFINSITGTAGAVLIVAPGESCPAGTTPQSFSASRPHHLSTHSIAPMRLGTSKKVAARLTLPGGNYLITGTATVTEGAAKVAVDQIITCVLLNPNGQTIPNTTTYTTLPANTSGEDLTIPISAYLTNMPSGNISAACKDSAPATSANGARIATPTDAQIYASLEEDQEPGNPPGGALDSWTEKSR
jgi:hypothetical protein